MSDSRIDPALLTPSTNGHSPAPQRGAKPRKAAKPSNAPSSRSKPSARQQAAAKAVLWSHWYTGGAVAMSAGLNGYASCAAPSLIGQIAGAALGAAVPVAVWGLAKLTAWTYRAGWKRLALVPGAVACVLLALSVTHCASAFAALTGTSLVMSGCLAVGIDCGLVASEAVGTLLSAVEE